MPEAPPGWVYVPDFLTVEEEAVLLSALEALEYEEVRMHGVAARRTVLHYGWRYGYESWEIQEAPPPPDFLLAVVERALPLLEGPADEVLVSRYPPGATIGWHRDAPMFGPRVVGLSLGAPCVMKFRRWRAVDRDVRKVTLDPRSAYVIAGEARTRWQHSVAPVKGLRYSISLRTVPR